MSHEKPLPPPPGHTWITWLSGRDAQVLLQQLCGAIGEPGVTLDTVRSIVDQWRANAHQALENDAWRACVDGYIEVYADARLYYFAHLAQERQHQRLPEPGP